MNGPFDPTTASPYVAPFLALLGEQERATLVDYPAHATLDAWFERARVARFADEAPLRFEFAAPKKKRRKKRDHAVDVASSYDGRITRERSVPTRANDLHDLCNFFAWLAFPRAKCAVHRRQFEALGRWIAPGSLRIPGARTREQDALTLFDEGGLVVVRGALPLRAGEPLPDTARVFAFGHALLEHFERSEAPIAATALVLEASPNTVFPDALDATLAGLVRDPARFTSPGLDALVMLARDGTNRVLPPADARARSAELSADA